MTTRLAACLVTLLPIAMFASASGQNAGSGTILVANRTGGSLSLFDVATGVEMARVPVGPAIPHEVAVSPDGRLAITGEYGPNDAPGRRVLVIDIANGQAMGRIDVGERSRPHSLVFMRDNRRAVVTLEQSDRIAMVDVVDRKVLRTYPTGGREGHMVRLSPDGRRAFVTSRGAEGTPSVISLDTDAPPVVITTGEGAEGLAGVLVPHGGPDGAPGQYLSVYDVKSRALLHRRLVHEGDRTPGGFGIHLAGEHAFVSDRADRSVFVLALDGLKTARMLATGHADPDGLAYSPLRLTVLEPTR